MQEIREPWTYSKTLASILEVYALPAELPQPDVLSDFRQFSRLVFRILNLIYDTVEYLKVVQMF